VTDPEDAGGSGAVGGFAFQGRTLAEYERFFDLDPGAWASVLDCGAGPGSFAAEVTDTTVVAADPAYASPVARLRERSAACLDDLARRLPEIRDRFVWTFYDDPADRLRWFRRAHERFFADLSAAPGRYVAAALPRLPFRRDAVEVCLCAHLLFLYGDRLDAAFHRRAVEELCRVARSEVRIYPLVGLDGSPSPHLEPTVAALEAAGHETVRRRVPFAFQPGADEMLVVT
jgi:SAM-dependent methyltransferase